jgi:hypothetical protein
MAWWVSVSAICGSPFCSRRPSKRSPVTIIYTTVFLSSYTNAHLGISTGKAHNNPPRVESSCTDGSMF